MIKRSLRLLAAIFTALILFAPVPAMAYNPFDYVDCSGAAAESAVCKSQKDTSNPIYGDGSFLAKITNVIALFAGVIAVFILVIAGARFITSGGDSAKVKQAREAIIYAVVGLVVIALSRTVIIFVISKVG
jgi:hypothetical protein